MGNLWILDEKLIRLFARRGEHNICMKISIDIARSRFQNYSGRKHSRQASSSENGVQQENSRIRDLQETLTLENESWENELPEGIWMWINCRCISSIENIKPFNIDNILDWDYFLALIAEAKLHRTLHN